MKAVSSSAIKGVFWTNLANYISVAIQFAGGVYLARRISPVHFGEIALLMSALSILGAITMFGQDHAILRQDKNVKSFIGTQLTLRLGGTFMVSLILLIIWQAGILPISNQMQYYFFLLYITLAVMQITGIYSVYLQKMFLFKRLALISVLETSGSMIIAVVLAYYGYALWALLWFWASRHLFKAFLVFILVPQRIGFSFDKKMAIKFFHFGKYVFWTNLIKRVYGRIDDISVGALINSATLGFYQRAYGLSGLLQQAVIGSITTVSEPIISTIKKDKDRLGRSLEFMGGLVLRLAMGVYVGMALVLPKFISLVYGENWLPAVPIFRWLLPFVLLQSFMLMLTGFHFISGESSKVAKIKTIELAVLGFLIYPLLLLYGVFGVAMAVNISAVVGLVFLLRYLKPIANFSVSKLFLNPLIAVAFGLLGFLIFNYLGFYIFSFLVFVIFFIVILLVLEFNFWQEVWFRVKMAINNK